MRNNFLLRAIIATVIALSSTAAAWAFDLINFPDPNGPSGSWNGGSITMRIRVPASAPMQDGTTYAQSVELAMLAWNAQLGRVQFLPVPETPGSGVDNNSVTEVFFSTTFYGKSFGANTLAVTLVSPVSDRPDGTYVFNEADVIFNSARMWNSYRGFLQSAQDIRRVAIHEFGHVLGLDHPDEAGQFGISAIMNSTVSGIDALQPDDIAGGQSLYGAAGSVTAPANDLFANATVVTLTSAAQQFAGSNVHSFKQAGEPFHGSGEPGGSSVWWKWVAPVSGSLKVTTRNSSFDTMLAAYSGASIETLNQLASNDDEQAPGSVPEPERIRTSIVTITVTAGTTYHFAVDGWAAEQGNIFLNLELTSAPVVTSSPSSRAVNSGANTTFTVAAYGSGTLSYQWRKGGANIPSATGASYTITGAMAADAGNYDCVVSNSLGSATSAAATLTINQATQTITFEAPAQLTYGATPFTLNASASSGLPVSFSIDFGPGQLSGSQLTSTNVGVVRVRASQAGNGTFAAAPDVVRDITIVAAPATVQLANLTATYDGAPKSATVTTNPAGLSTSVTYNGSATAPTNAGSYTLSATITDARYQGSVTNTFTIAKATQTITFAALDDRTFSTTPVNLSATASSGLPVSFTVIDGHATVDGASLWLLGDGAITVRATQAGDANREPAPSVERTFTVATSFTSWQFMNFTEDELTFASLSGPSADFDGDGLANLIEYALGLNPRQPQPAPIELTTEATNFTFVYLRPSNRSDLSYIVQASSDLVNWTTTGITHAQSGTEGDRQRWSATRAASSPLFFRLVVERQ